MTDQQHLHAIAESLESRLGYIRTDPDGVKRNAEDDADFLRRIASRLASSLTDGHELTTRLIDRAGDAYVAGDFSLQTLLIAAYDALAGKLVTPRRHRNSSTENT